MQNQIKTDYFYFEANKVPVSRFFVGPNLANLYILLEKRTLPLYYQVIWFNRMHSVLLIKKKNHILHLGSWDWFLKTHFLVSGK